MSSAHRHSARAALHDGSLASLLKNRTGVGGHAKAVARHEVALPGAAGGAGVNSFGIVFHGFWFSLAVLVLVVGGAALLHFAVNNAAVQRVSARLLRRAAAAVGVRSVAPGLRKKARHSNMLSQALASAGSGGGGIGIGGGSALGSAGAGVITGRRESSSIEMVGLPGIAGPRGGAGAPLATKLSNSLGVKPILARSDVAALTPHLPARYRHLRHWELVFSTARHGYRLGALYDCVQAHAQRMGGTPPFSDPFVLVVRTSKGNKIGAYGSHRLVGSGSTGGFAGNGETLLFSLYPLARVYGCNARLARTTPHYWTASDRSLAFGAGTVPALWLDAHLEHGRTEGSATFASTQPLTGAGNEDFLCAGLELWSLASAV